MNSEGCFLCGQPDHWRDLCPLLQPADSLAEHQRRIRLFIDRMAENHMTVAAKREAVKYENEMWNSRKGKAA